MHVVESVPSAGVLSDPVTRARPTMTHGISNHLLIGLSTAVLCVCGAGARAQNDWQSPDPYFGVFQHRQAATPEAERRYRAEIAPQQPQRLHEHRPQTPPSPAWRPRSLRQRMRAINGR